MADSKISALTALTGANLSTDDDIPLVDTSVTTTKKITSAELAIGLLKNPTYGSQTLTDAATISWDMSSGAIGTVTLGDNRIMGAPTNLKVGTVILVINQDGTGSRTITSWNAVFKWTAGAAPVLSTAASAKDVLTFFCDGTNLHGGLFVRGSA
mgnify:CR=1 FL=1